MRTASDTYPKEISVSELGGIYARIGAAGLGAIGGESTWEWLTRVLGSGRGAVPWTLGSLCSFLATKATDWVEPIYKGHEDQVAHVFIITAIDNTTISVVLVSNAIELLTSNKIAFGKARPRFTVHQITLPCALAIGSGAAHITWDQLDRLQRLVESGVENRPIFDKIARVSWMISQSEPTVGPSCSVSVTDFDAAGNSSQGALNYQADGTYGGVTVDESVMVIGGNVVRLGEILQLLPPDIKRSIGMDLDAETGESN